ncbi:MAG TPA: adenylate/guanylate cyclase domain-containing protein, partial [Actinomycetota bacterium]
MSEGEEHRPGAGPGPRGGAPQDEMRPVTALFADVVGSTALGERLAPDEVKALIGECVSAMARAVETYGGYVQAYQGDGICALFGLPRAHEDDPSRA